MPDKSELVEHGKSLVKKVLHLEPSYLPSEAQFSELQNLVDEDSEAYHHLSETLNKYLLNRLLIRSFGILGEVFTLVLVRQIAHMESTGDTVTVLGFFIANIISRIAAVHFANAEEKTEFLALSLALDNIERMPESIGSGLTGTISSKKPTILASTASNRFMNWSPEFQQWMITGQLLNLVSLFPNLAISAGAIGVLTWVQSQINTKQFQSLAQTYNEAINRLIQLQQKGKTATSEQRLDVKQLRKKLIGSTDRINLITKLSNYLPVLQSLFISNGALLTSSVLVVMQQVQSMVASTGPAAVASGSAREGLGNMVGATLTKEKSTKGIAWLTEIIELAANFDLLINTQEEWDALQKSVRELLATRPITNNPKPPFTNDVPFLQLHSMELMAPGKSEPIVTPFDGKIRTDMPILICGPSGSGKTTALFHMLMRSQQSNGLVRFYEDENHLDALKIGSVSERNEKLLLLHPDFAMKSGVTSLLLPDLVFQDNDLQQRIIAQSSISHILAKNLEWQAFFTASWEQKSQLANSDKQFQLALDSLESYLKQYLQEADIFDQAILNDAWIKPIDSFSKGQQMRLLLSAYGFFALTSQQDFVVLGLDEPHSGADTTNRSAQASTAQKISAFIKKVQKNDFESIRLHPDKRIVVIATTHLNGTEINQHFGNNVTQVIIDDGNIHIATENRGNAVLSTVEETESPVFAARQYWESLEPNIPFAVLDENGCIFKDGPTYRYDLASFEKLRACWFGDNLQLGEDGAPKHWDEKMVADLVGFISELQKCSTDKANEVLAGITAENLTNLLWTMTREIAHHRRQLIIRTRQPEKFNSSKSRTVNNIVSKLDSLFSHALSLIIAMPMHHPYLQQVVGPALFNCWSFAYMDDEIDKIFNRMDDEHRTNYLQFREKIIEMRRIFLAKASIIPGNLNFSGDWKNDIVIRSSAAEMLTAHLHPQSLIETIESDFGKRDTYYTVVYKQAEGRNVDDFLETLSALHEDSMHIARFDEQTNYDVYSSMCIEANVSKKKIMVFDLTQTHRFSQDAIIEKIFQHSHFEHDRKVIILVRHPIKTQQQNKLPSRLSIHSPFLSREVSEYDVEYLRTTAGNSILATEGLSLEEKLGKIFPNFNTKNIPAVRQIVAYFLQGFPMYEARKWTIADGFTLYKTNDEPVDDESGMWRNELYSNQGILDMANKLYGEVFAPEILAALGSSDLRPSLASAFDLNRPSKVEDE